MRKFYSSLLSIIAASSLSISAQQLPNADFEGGEYASSAWTSTEVVSLGSTYKSPTSWTIAHVAGYKLPVIGWQGKTNVGSLVDGYNGGKAVQLTNQEKLSNPIPGYVTYGTPWNTANTSGQNKDGGTFGGINFAYRPDALSIMYKRTLASGSTEQATIVAYSWKGTYTQTNVPGNVNNTPTKATLTDRDRNILGMETTYGDTPTWTPGAECVASINHAITAAAADWTSLVIPFEYKSTAAPEKINVIFSAANYFSTTPVKGNTLTVDNVKLLYFSRLASLAIDGTPLQGFSSDVYNYTVDQTLPADASAFTYTTLGNSQSGRVAVSLDAANAVATLTVTNANAGGTDVDGATQHVYTLQFNKQSTDPEPGVEGTEYSGRLTVEMFGELIVNTTGEKVYIKDNGDGTCQFALPNFSIDLGEGPQVLGDIIVNPVNMTTDAEGNVTYHAVVPGYDKLLEGALVCDITINGTGKGSDLKMNIEVMWEGTPINVVFNTNPFEGSTVYNGSLLVEMFGDAVVDDPSVNIYITPNEDKTACTLALPNFTFDLGEGPVVLGDIIVDDVKMTTDGTTIKYDGSVTGYDKLLDGALVCDLTITGTETDNKLMMVIEVNWEGTIITVTFNGENTLAAIGDITIDVDPNAPVEYYNLQGIRVNPDNAAPGIYIIRQGNKVTKALLR